MIIIKHIDFLEVDRTRCEILSKPHFEPIFVKDNEGPRLGDFAEIHKELIVGRRFIRPSDGTDIYIGVSKQAQDIIGLQYEAWNNIEKPWQAPILTQLKWLLNNILTYSLSRPDTPSGM